MLLFIKLTMKERRIGIKDKQLVIFECEVGSNSLEWLESGYIDTISPSYLIQDETDEEALISARQVIPLHWIINGTI